MVPLEASCTLDKVIGAVDINESFKRTFISIKVSSSVVTLSSIATTFGANSSGSTF